jgi:hypothetical protein
MTRRLRGYHPLPTAADRDAILDDRPAYPAAPSRPPSVPVRLQSNYYWSPPSLFSGLVAAALPEMTAPAWKVCSVVAMAQLNQATQGPDASHGTQPVALSIGDLQAATGLARVTVIGAIKAAVETRWLTQEKRRTPHGGNAVALYSLNWRRAEQAERARRKRELDAKVARH